MRIKYWNIPNHILVETAYAFSRGRHEVFVIWTSTLHFNGSTCEITRCIVPKQRAEVTLSGAYVHIEGAELSRIQFDNFDSKERSVIQLHTHPSSNVNMSSLDKEWEVVKHVGALSIIVPSYGDRGLQGFPGVNVYEREQSGWRLWSEEEKTNRLRVEL